MRYQLKDGIPVPVKVVRTEAYIISNPPDELLDELGVGYVLEDREKPEFDETLQRASFSWEIENEKICRVWTLTDFTEEELKARRRKEIQSEINAVNADYADAENRPIQYTNGKYYLPRYIPSYWTPIHAAGAEIYPMVYISDINDVPELMTFAEFSALFKFMIDQSQLIITETNAKLVALRAELEALNDA